MNKKANITPHKLYEIESEIVRYQEKIRELEAERERAEKREGAAQRASDAAEAVLKEAGLTIEDLFAYHRGRIRTWITKQKKTDDTIWSDLRSHFFVHGDVAAGKPRRRKRKVSQSAELDAPGRLKPGKYLNPHTNESAEVGEHLPPTVAGWVLEHGQSTVEQWRQRSQ